MKEESLLQKMVIGIMFILVLLLAMWVPDFVLTEDECLQQSPRAITIGLCSEPIAK